MRELSELVDSAEPAWPLVETWLADATNSCDVLTSERGRGEASLLALQVTTRSPLGAIALHAGGLLVDDAWLRILGGGHRRLAGLEEWNGRGERSRARPHLADAIIVAHDAVGGFFALNGGAFGREELGGTFYFAPDNLRWESLEFGYSSFVQWALSGDLESFYAAARWPGWRDELRGVGDRGFSIYPFLSTEGPPPGSRSRRLVPMTELWALHCQLANDFAGASAQRCEWR